MSEEIPDEKFFPSREDVLDFRATTQILGILEHTQADIHLDTKTSRREEITASKKRQPTDVLMWTTSSDFVNLLVRGSETIAGIPGHLHSVELAFSSYGVERTDSFSNNISNGGVSVTKNPDRGDLEPPVASTPADAYRVAVGYQTIVGTELPEDYSIGPWLMDSSNCSALLHEQKDGTVERRWRVMFSRHVKLVLGLITRAVQTKDREYWYHRTQDYVAIACVPKMKMRLDRGKSTFRSPAPGKARVPGGSNLWDLLTASPDQHSAAAGQKASKIARYLTDIPLPQTCRRILREPGVISKTDVVPFAYNMQGKWNLGIAVATALRDVSNSIDQCYIANSRFQEHIMDVERAPQEERLKSLLEASRSVSRSVDRLERLMSSYIIRHKDKTVDLVGRYLTWVEWCHSLTNTANYFPCWAEIGDARKDQKTLLKELPSTTSARTGPPKKTASTKKAKDPARPGSSAKKLPTKATSSTRSSKSPEKAVPTSAAASEAASAVSAEEDTLLWSEEDEDDDVPLKSTESDKKLNQWAASAKRWINLILLHHKALQGILYPNEAVKEAIDSFLATPLAIHLVDVSSGVQDREMPDLNKHFAKLTSGDKRAKDERDGKLKEWVDKMGVADRWYNTPKFGGSLHCETVLLSLSALESEFRAMKGESTSPLDIKDYLNTTEHQIEPALMDFALKMSKVLAVSKRCCPACGHFVHILDAERKCKAFLRAGLNFKKLDSAWDADVSIMYSGVHNTWSACSLPSWLPFRYFDEIADHARQRVARWADLIFSDLPLEEKTKRRVKIKSESSEHATTPHSKRPPVVTGETPVKGKGKGRASPPPSPTPGSSKLPYR